MTSKCQRTDRKTKNEATSKAKKSPYEHDMAVVRATHRLTQLSEFWWLDLPKLGHQFGSVKHQLRWIRGTTLSNRLVLNDTESTKIGDGTVGHAERNLGLRAMVRFLGIYAEPFHRGLCLRNVECVLDFLEVQLILQYSSARSWLCKPARSGYVRPAPVSCKHYVGLVCARPAVIGTATFTHKPQLIQSTFYLKGNGLKFSSLWGYLWSISSIGPKVWLKASRSAMSHCPGWPNYWLKFVQILRFLTPNNVYQLRGEVRFQWPLSNRSHPGSMSGIHYQWALIKAKLRFGAQWQ